MLALRAIRNVPAPQPSAPAEAGAVDEKRTPQETARARSKKRQTRSARERLESAAQPQTGESRRDHGRGAHEPRLALDPSACTLRGSHRRSTIEEEEERTRRGEPCADPDGDDGRRAQ